VDGARNVARAALAAGAGRLVLTSTWSTYGLGRAEISEDAARLGLRSRVAYVRTKALAEEEVRRAGADGLRFAILNPAHVIGRYDARNWGRMFRMLDAGTLPGAPRLRGAFCHGAAVAAAHLAAARPGAPGGNYLLPGLDAGFDEVIGLAAEILGRPAPRRAVPAWLLRAAARAAVLRAAVTGREPDLTPAGVALMANHPRVASDRARREFGYAPPAALRPLVEDACAWLRAEGLVR
jgi:nucleoside-diphosphate-sugar epimerase